MKPAEVFRKMQVHTITKEGFAFKHITYDRTKGSTNGVRTVYNAVLRKRMNKDKIKVSPSNYIFYTDRELDEPRLAIKCLVIAVAFPPNYNWISIRHYED